MPAFTELDLHHLYVKFAEKKAREGRTSEAADAYALALYYARRTNSTRLADYCRGVIARLNPNHVACRDGSAPLYFAQLLMRYPADDVHRAVSMDTSVRTAPLSEPVGVFEPLAEEAPAEVAAPREIRFGSMESAPLPPRESIGAMTSPSPNPFPPYSLHSMVDLGTVSESSRQPAGRIADEHRPRASRRFDFEREENETSVFWKFVNFVGIMMAMVGCVALGFFGRELLPVVRKFEFAGRVEQVVRDFIGKQIESFDAPAQDASAPTATWPKAVEVTIADDESNSDAEQEMQPDAWKEPLETKTGATQRTPVVAEIGRSSDRAARSSDDPLTSSYDPPVSSDDPPIPQPIAISAKSKSKKSEPEADPSWKPSDLEPQIGLRPTTRTTRYLQP